MVKLLRDHADHLRAINSRLHSNTSKAMTSINKMGIMMDTMRATHRIIMEVEDTKI
jgi:hypothetical protein